MPRPSVLVILIAIASTPAVAAERPSFSYEVVVESPATIEATLRQSLREGRTCAAVARPVGMALARTMAVLLTRPEGATPAADPPAPNVRVLTSTPDGVGELARRMDASAVQGFGVCGLTFTTPIWGRPGGDYAVVVVMTRTDDKPTGTSYRVVHSTGRRGEWTAVTQAGADGFAVTRVASRPQPDVSSTSDMVLLAERTAASKPVTFDLELGGNAPALQKDLDKAIKRGSCDVQATWATPERMTLLLSKPIEGPCERPHEYELEESSEFMGLSVSSTDGTLLGLHRVKDGFMSLYDGKDRSLEYTVEQAVLADEDARPVRLSREHRWFVDKLNADGGRGYLPVDVAWRAGTTEGARAIDVILARPRQ
jgi:hypothetical protein